jgi:hypothetical protein
MFAFVFLCLVLFRQRPLRQADHSSKGVLPGVRIRLKNLSCVMRPSSLEGLHSHRRWKHHYRVHKTPPLALIPGQVDAVDTLIPYFFAIHLIVTSHLVLHERLRNDLFPADLKPHNLGRDIMSTSFCYKA